MFIRTLRFLIVCVELDDPSLMDHLGLLGNSVTVSAKIRILGWVLGSS